MSLYYKHCSWYWISPPVLQQSTDLVVWLKSSFNRAQLSCFRLLKVLAYYKTVFGVSDEQCQVFDVHFPLTSSAVSYPRKYQNFYWKKLNRTWGHWIGSKNAINCALWPCCSCSGVRCYFFCFPRVLEGLDTIHQRNKDVCQKFIFNTSIDIKSLADFLKVNKWD